MANKTVTVRPSGGTYTTLYAAIDGEIVANHDLVAGLDGILTISIEGDWSGGHDASARLIAYIDGRVQVQIAADALVSATTIIPEDLPDGIASGAVMTLISGTGPATITTSAPASAGARTMAVSALSDALSADAIYEYAGTSQVGLPMSPGVGQTVNITWSNGANKIFTL